MPTDSIINWLPGALRLERGNRADYARLERFHYRPGRPATWARVWTATYAPPNLGRPTLAAVAVLSWPCVCCKGRELFFGMAGWTYRQRLRWANEHVRTISRVIVHPQFRGVGLASALVRRIVSDCPTRYAEALAVMGRAHPFFEKAGMTRVQTAAEGAVYYLFDKQQKEKSVSHR